jgi:hypothetical protein
MTPAHPQQSIGPERMTLHFCPACQRTVFGSYGLEAGRKTCSKQWHKAAAKAVHYVRADVTYDRRATMTEVWVVLTSDGKFVSVHGSEVGANSARMHVPFGRVERWSL